MNWGIVIGLGLMIMFGSLIWIGIDDHISLLDFCKDNNFSHAERATWKWEDNKCIRIEDNTRIESLVDRCDKSWCFVKQEKAE